ncbi:hypothetical protein HK405_007140, partial [Cladochytrium tenue]
FFVPLGGFLNAVAYFYFAHVTIDTSEPIATTSAVILSSAGYPSTGLFVNNQRIDAFSPAGLVFPPTTYDPSR